MAKTILVFISFLGALAFAHQNGQPHTHDPSSEEKSELNSKLHRLCSDPLIENVDDVEEVIHNGADINFPHPRSGQTPLMSASLNGKAKLVKFLLEKGADPKIAEKDGYTPVHGAGFQGQWEVMKVLKEFGLDTNHMHEDGFTPFHRACWGTTKRHTELVRNMVNEFGVDPNLEAKPTERYSHEGTICRLMSLNKDTLKFLDLNEAETGTKEL